MKELTTLEWIITVLSFAIAIASIILNFIWLFRGYSFREFLVNWRELFR